MSSADWLLNVDPGPGKRRLAGGQAGVNGRGLTASGVGANSPSMALERAMKCSRLVDVNYPLCYDGEDSQGEASRERRCAY
jgi:hypothetical protein